MYNIIGVCAYNLYIWRFHTSWLGDNFKWAKILVIYVEFWFCSQIFPANSSSPLCTVACSLPPLEGQRIRNDHTHFCNIPTCAEEDKVERMLLCIMEVNRSLPGESHTGSLSYREHREEIMLIEFVKQGWKFRGNTYMIKKKSPNELYRISSNGMNTSQ